MHARDGIGVVLSACSSSCRETMAVLVVPSFCGCNVMYVNVNLSNENTQSLKSLQVANLLLILLWNKVLTQGKNNCLGTWPLWNVCKYRKIRDICCLWLSCYWWSILWVRIIDCCRVVFWGFGKGPMTWWSGYHSWYFHNILWSIYCALRPDYPPFSGSFA